VHPGKEEQSIFFLTSRRALALEALGRLGEALEHYQQGVINQRWVCAWEPAEVRHRDDLEKRLRQISGLYWKLGRPADAIAAILERESLWPDDPTVSRSVAGDLAAAALLDQTQVFTVARLLHP